MDERRAAVGEVLAPRDVVQDIWDKIDACRRDAKILPEPSCIMILGETGAGKTTLLNEYAKRYPARRIDGIIRRPVLMVELPTKSTMNDAATTLLRALDDADPDRGKLEARTHRVRCQLVVQQVEIILIDEFQHIVESSGEKTLNRVGDWLKQLTKATRIPLVMAGMRSCRNVVDVNKQFAGITPHRINLGDFNWNDETSRTAYRLFLAEIDVRLPFDEKARLGDIGLAKPIFEASHGNIRRTMLLIRSAALTAIDRGASRIEMADLAVAFTGNLQATAKVDGNPFLIPDIPPKKQARA